MMYSRDYVDELERVRLRFPKFKFEDKKDSMLMKVISWCLFIITFGKFTRQNFMSGFITTIGYTIYIPDTWALRTDVSKHLVLFHESVHMEQGDRDWLYPLKYLVWPFPAIWANARLEYEAEAYGKQIALSNIVYGFRVDGAQLTRAADNLSGPAYFWPTTNKQKALDRIKYFINLELNRTK